MLLQINDVADVIIIFGKWLSGSRVGIVIEKKEAKPKIRTVQTADTAEFATSVGPIHHHKLVVTSTLFSPELPSLQEAIPSLSLICLLVGSCVCVCVCVCAHTLSRLLCLTVFDLWTEACQALLSEGSSKQEYQSGWSCPPPAFYVASIGRPVLYHQCHLGNPCLLVRLCSCHTQSMQQLKAPLKKEVKPCHSFLHSDRQGSHDDPLGFPWSSSFLFVLLVFAPAWIHSSPSGCLLLFKHTQGALAPGPLHYLFSLPRMFFPHSPTELTFYLLHIFAQISFSNATYTSHTI